MSRAFSQQSVPGPSAFGHRNRLGRPDDLETVCRLGSPPAAPQQFSIRDPFQVTRPCSSCSAPACDKHDIARQLAEWRNDRDFEDVLKDRGWTGRCTGLLRRAPRATLRGDVGRRQPEQRRVFCRPGPGPVRFPAARNAPFRTGSGHQWRPNTGRPAAG